EPLSDRAIVEAGRYEFDDLQLTRSQRIQDRSLDHARRTRRCRQKSTEFVDKSRPGLLRVYDPVVTALQRHEPCSRNERCQSTPLLERYARVGTRMEYKRRASDLRRDLTKVEMMIGPKAPDRGLRRRGDTHQFVERSGLIGRRIRDEQRRGELAEGRIVIAPSELDRLELARRLLAQLR